MKFGSLDDWLAWQESLHPSGIELGLDRVREVYRRMDLAPPPVTITVGGTNGKGSCVALLDAMLRQAGYHVGSYTSPHLARYNERVCLDGRAVSDETLMTAFQRVEAARQGTLLTYFEFGTLAALAVFSEASPDVVVLEVGLGGRLDAVNILDADATLVTTVDLDHAAWLGDDRESIGREKAGIFRAGQAAVYGAGDPPQSVLDAAKMLGAPLWVSGRDYRYKLTPEGWDWESSEGARTGLPLPRMRGRHQVQNAAAVLAVLQRLKERIPVDQHAVRAGLLSADLAARVDVRPGTPTLVIDVAHNPQAAHALADNLRRLPRQGRLLAVFGALADKDVEGVVRPLSGCVDHWYLGSIEDDRGLGGDALVDRAAGLLVGATRYGSVVEAFDVAVAAAAEQDVVLVFGSFMAAGAVLRDRLGAINDGGSND